MSVTNNGPDTPTGVTISDPMPAGNNVRVGDHVAGLVHGRRNSAVQSRYDRRRASVTITLVATPTAVGTVTNTVTVVGNEAETNTANNTASASVPANQQTPPPTVFCVAVSKVTRSSSSSGARPR